ncbi:HAD family hydrolase [Pelotalea chapellei]|uniref:phosphoglycolate phosphatase n=1 Tax=Pelotalea chapellei TaxID=44671 RepID=A0ABS5U9B3_9BACT|nr:HAD family hydrolase [Pelotalea chapellei]MBT1072255.1 HAD family hydrolase [Pelotalea chapellei]
MQSAGAVAIRAIVFDLDGTLYVSPEFAAVIQEAAVIYMAALKGMERDEMRAMMAATRARMTEESGLQPTLSAVCTELGGNIIDLHGFFSKYLKPEECLVRDDRVVTLLERLRSRYGLYVYTNNNHSVTTRIIDCLGLDNIFSAVFAIDDLWIGKPDEARLDQILKTIGHAPGEVLFVGDRFDVDLRLPEQKGCPIYLSQSVDQLLRLDALLNSN